MATRPPIDRSKIDDIKKKAAEGREGTMNKVLAELEEPIAELAYDHGSDDPRIDVIRMVTALKPVNTDMVRQVFGLGGTTADDGPPALSDREESEYGPDVQLRGGKVYLPECDAEGNVVAGSYLPKEAVDRYADAGGYWVVIREGKMLGFRRNIAPADDTRPIPAVQDDSAQVPLYDKKGRHPHGQEIAIGAGKQRTNHGELRPEFGGTGLSQIIAFHEIPRFGFTSGTGGGGH